MKPELSLSFYKEDASLHHARYHVCLYLCLCLLTWDLNPDEILHPSQVSRWLEETRRWSKEGPLSYRANSSTPWRPSARFHGRGLPEGNFGMKISSPSYLQMVQSLSMAMMSDLDILAFLMTTMDLSSYPTSRWWMKAPTLASSPCFPAVTTRQKYL